MKKAGCIIVFLGCVIYAGAQTAFDYYISNSGNDANAGTTPAAPKKTIAAAGLGFSGSLRLLKIGFKAGDVFSESFNPAVPLVAGSYFDMGSAAKFAVLNGAKPFETGWVRTAGTHNLFEQVVALQNFGGYGIGDIGAYSYVYVFEVDKLTEQTLPITSRRLLKFVRTQQEADNTPGSFYEPITTDETNKKIFIHPSNNLSPNNNERYRYEVSVTGRAFNSTYQERNYFEKLWVTGFGAGNGMLPSGAGTVFNRMIFGPGAAIHHLGLRGASINNSLFLPGPKNTNGYAVVFYDTEGFRRHNTIRNSIFMDIKNPVYAHTGGGTNFAALELDNVIAFGDTAEADNTFSGLADTDSMIMTKVYTDNHKYVYGYSFTKHLQIKNCVFKDIIAGVLLPNYKNKVQVTNTLMRIKGGLRSGGFVLSDSNTLYLSNCILHVRSQEQLPVNDAAAGFISGCGRPGTRVNVSGNIFICDIQPVNFMVAASTGTLNGVTAGVDRWDRNVYIIAGGAKMIWTVFNGIFGSGNRVLETFNDWKQQSGQDQNSLFYDLRNDPRGLKAIFNDPENGDYSFANTAEARQIKSLQAGMQNPVTCFLKKPGYEEAVNIIINNGVLTANACRNPCMQSDIRINTNFTADTAGSKSVLLKWDIDDEAAVDHFEVLRAFGTNDFITIGNIAATGQGRYTFSDSSAAAGITYRYSLSLVTKLVEKCYSEVKTVTLKNSRLVSIYPNPALQHINIGLNDYTGNAKIWLYNSTGAIVLQQGFTVEYGKAPKLDISTVAKGVYWLKVETATGASTRPFVIQ